LANTPALVAFESDVLAAVKAPFANEAAELAWSKAEGTNDEKSLVESNLDGLNFVGILLFTHIIC
jgi:hypothetical protein